MIHIASANYSTCSICIISHRYHICYTEENKIAERDLDTRYEEIKHKDASDRSDLEMDFLEAYEKSQEETKRRGELTRKYELCKKEKDTLQEENASLRGEIRSVRQCCQTLKAQLDYVFQQLDRMETKIR